MNRQSIIVMGGADCCSDENPGIGGNGSCHKVKDEEAFDSVGFDEETVLDRHPDPSSVWACKFTGIPALQLCVCPDVSAPSSIRAISMRSSVPGWLIRQLSWTE